jgi:molybdate transport system substrate-binding protein
MRPAFNGCGASVASTSLKLISSMAAREVLRELVGQYQDSSGRAVTAEAAGGIDVAARVRSGEAVDVVVLARNAIDQLIAEGKLRAGSRVDLVKSGVAVAVCAGAPRPDIATEAAVRQAVLSAKSVSYSTGPSGTHLEKLFERWGILGDIRSRIVVPPPGVPVGSLVASGAAELGFQQLSELLNVPGLQVIGPLPAPIQTVTTFSGGISVRSAEPGAARALLDYLASPVTTGVKERHGMEPP